MKFLLFVILLLTFYFSPNPSSAQTFTDLHVGSGGFFYTIYDSKLYFNAYDESNGNELWVTNGSVAGTHILKDIYSGSLSSNPLDLTVFNGELYFRAYTSEYGDEIWRSDGTDSGTALLEDIYPGSYGCLPHDLNEFNGKLFFGASDSTFGNELWCTDGTVPGTQMIKDINLSTGSSSTPEYFLAFNNELFFSADDGYADGREPWVTDGTTNDTHLIKDIFPGGELYNSFPNEFTSFNGRVYFRANDGYRGVELWATDGTDTNTTLVKDIRVGVESSDPGLFVILNNELYFRAQGISKGFELWKSDGTDTGTVLLKDIKPGNGGSLKFTTEFHLFNDKIYFAADDGTHGLELWISDGTDTGTILLKDIKEGSGDSSPRVFTDYNGKLYFIANDHLWQTDGTDSGTFQIEPLGVTYPYPLANSPQMIVFNGELYFNAIFDSTTLDLWKYNDAIATGTSIPELTAANFLVYPNPCSQILNVESNIDLNDCSLTIENTLGQTIYQSHFYSRKNQFDLSLVQQGFYVAMIYSGQKVYVQKILKL